MGRVFYFLIVGDDIWFMFFLIGECRPMWPFIMACWHLNGCGSMHDIKQDMLHDMFANINLLMDLLINNNILKSAST